MRVVIDLVDRDIFLTTINEKHSVIVDGAREIAPSAMDFLLVGLGNCTAIDVVDILRKMKEPIKKLRVEVFGERAEEPPRVYTYVKLRYIATGKIKIQNLERAIKLSQEKYCSASIMFKRSGTIIEYEFEVLDD